MAAMAQPQMVQPSSPQPSSADAAAAESLAASLHSLTSFSEIAALVNSARILPPQFILPETDRPDIAHDGFLPQLDLPSFDLSAYDSCLADQEEERIKMVRRLSTVCKEWGFFHVVNHGVPVELIRKMESFGRSFFELPSNVKESLPRYRGKFNPEKSKHSWGEAINLELTPAVFNDEFINLAWPGGNKEFSDCFEKYASALHDLGQTILKILTEGLGLEPTTFTQHFGKHSSGFRFNYYPPCPQPSLAIGLGAHTDPNAITLLYQDEVGGLQIRGKDNNWVAVKPQPDAFIVNVGDILKAWSNCTYRCAEHRAVLNSTKARLSFGFFCGPEVDTTVIAAEELVDAEHPVRFKPFKWQEYRMKRINSKSGAEALEMFAGIYTEPLKGRVQDEQD